MNIPYLDNHLKSRFFERERYSYVSIDDENEVVTFALWNLSGQMVGYQQYRPYGTKSTTDKDTAKYYPFISPGQIGVFGLETFNYRNDILILAEGVFDICRVHNLNLPGVAVLGNDPAHLRSWLFSLGRKIITIPDADKAGQALKKYGHMSLDLSPFLRADLKNGSVDLGRLTSQQVSDLLKYI